MKAVVLRRTVDLPIHFRCRDCFHPLYGEPCSKEEEYVTITLCRECVSKQQENLKTLVVSRCLDVLESEKSSCSAAESLNEFIVHLQNRIKECI